METLSELESVDGQVQKLGEGRPMLLNAHRTKSIPGPPYKPDVLTVVELQALAQAEDNYDHDSTTQECGKSRYNLSNIKHGAQIAGA